MKKLLKKSGFTIVELIVVIAMLGIMVAIIVPLLSTTDARKNEVREYARSFYSNVQELMVDERLAGTEMPGGNSTKYILVCAQVYENKSTYEDVIVYMDHSVTTINGFNATPEKLTDKTPGDNTYDLDASSPYYNYAEFATALRKLLLGNERSGVYFAIVDNHYRVVSSYFVEAKTNTESFDTIYGAVKNKSFTQDNVLEGRYTGAWPEQLAEKNSGKSFLSEP